MKIAVAPCCWGVEGATAQHNPAWTVVLEQAQAAGYRGIELGPYGYLPIAEQKLVAALQRYGLETPAGFILEPLQDPDRSSAIESSARQICALLRAVGGRSLVVIDAFDEGRVQTAGRSDDAPRLGPEGWKTMLTVIAKLASIAQDEDVELAIHSHAGSFIEFQDEIHRVLEETDPDSVGLCVDTGHLAYAGIDSLEMVQSHTRRVKLLHFKDVDGAVLARARAQKLSFWEAVAERVFVPLGAGSIDFEAIASELRASDYRGWITVEQDRVASDVSPAYDNVVESLAFIRRIGLDGDRGSQ